MRWEEAADAEAANREQAARMVEKRIVDEVSW
jgi:hypothetical protein